MAKVPGAAGGARRASGGAARLARLSLFVVIGFSLVVGGRSSDLSTTGTPRGPRLSVDGTVAARVPIPLRASGRTLVLTKIVNVRTGRVREVVIDKAAKTAVSLTAALANERRSWKRNYGSADAALVARLDRARRDASIPVGIRWAPRGETAVRAALDRVKATILRNRRGLVEAAVPAALCEPSSTVRSSTRSLWSRDQRT